MLTEQEIKLLIAMLEEFQAHLKQEWFEFESDEQKLLDKLKNLC